MDKIINVKNLKISFRTQSGTLKAVRDISFDLERGRTLAIVGESGSGKSVTSKAILGILAGNSIVEGGEILYDGKDLLKISEEEMCTIRGDKISMIFQDPLSALNPIVKIGKQITEAMLLKNKTSRKQAREEFNSTLALLNTNMASTSDASKAKELTETFDKFCIEANKLENSYNISYSNAQNVKEEIIDFVFRTSKQQKLDIKNSLNTYAKLLKEIKDPFFTAGYTDKLNDLSTKLNNVKGNFDKKTGVIGNDLSACLDEIKTLLEQMLEQPRPNFFRIGFYSMKNPSENLTGRNIDELNEMALTYLNENFMNEFITEAAKGIEASYDAALVKKAEVLPVLAEAKVYYQGEFDKKGALEAAKKYAAAVDATIDRLEIQKDSQAYTFRTSLVNAINKYFAAVVNNPKEEARFAKQSAKRDALIAKGKTVEWKVIPKNVYDLTELKNDIVKLIDNLTAHYEKQIAVKGTIDFNAKALDMIEYFKDKASKVVYEVTPSMAKERAIKLMEEVGINEPRMRYYQYPFEFSGGMRQRIVIAIALAADPEILICDEPTTALDVTIQAQILELINRLKKERNLSIIFITHDLGVVANMADDIAVMYAGKIVEYGTADDIFYDPRHPYTWALLSSMPDLDTKEKLDAIPGTPPNMIYPPVGDAFADRNKYAMQIDFEMQPPMFEISETHRAATWLLHPDAPKVDIPKTITDRIERMKAKSGGAE